MPHRTGSIFTLTLKIRILIYKCIETKHITKPLLPYLSCHTDIITADIDQAKCDRHFKCGWATVNYHIMTILHQFIQKQMDLKYHFYHFDMNI